MMATSSGRPERCIWGWGSEAGQLGDDEVRGLGELVAPFVGGAVRDAISPPTLADLDLPAPRLTPPDSLTWADDPAERAGHTYGKSFRDVVRALSGRLERPPDVVALPTADSEVASWLDWSDQVGAVVVPYGGGSSVVGGVEAPTDDERPVVSLDLRHLSGVTEVDPVSYAARLQGGTLGPDVEAGLAEHGFTLRHYPQSFEFSTVGGWLATRSAGHFATLVTHIDDTVESIRAHTPSGVWESRRLPGSGAGPSPDRLLLGSEGTLGVITEAWLRVLPRPTFRASGVARFPTFASGMDAARALVQSRLWPSNCRLVDSTEALITGAGDGSAHLLLVAFESADHPVDSSMARAVELVADHGGELVVRPPRTDAGEGGAPDAADAWRASFLRAPYLRDGLVRLGLVNETFETAITWDRIAEFVPAAIAAVRGALADVGASPAIVTCRLTHVYPDGAAPYFTIIAPGRPGLDRLAQWDEVKAAAMEVIDAAGATVTHHHGVGRDHRRGYDRQRPDPFARALVAAKAELDPYALLNPGVLVDPRR